MYLTIVRSQCKLVAAAGQAQSKLLSLAAASLRDGHATALTDHGKLLSLRRS